MRRGPSGQAPDAPGGADAAERAEDSCALHAAALVVLRLGPLPVVGVDMALPTIAAAGHDDAAHEEVMMSVSTARAKRCNACPQIGGPSKSADDGVERFVAAGRPVFRGIGGIPGAARP